jgi:hypothetical protein
MSGSIVSSKIVTNGLVLYLDAVNTLSYPKTGNTWYDLTTNGFIGQLNNTPLFVTTGGTSFSFDGTNENVNLGNLSSLSFTSGTFSVEIWVNVPSSWSGPANINQYPNLISKGGSSGWDTDGWSLYLFRDYLGGFGYGLGIRNGSTVTSSSTYVLLQSSDLDKFINITACMDLTSIKMYQNGVLKKTVTSLTPPLGNPLVGPAENSSNVVIASGPSSQYFPGKISNIKLYDRKLSDSEVLQNYNSTKVRYI